MNTYTDKEIHDFNSSFINLEKDLINKLKIQYAILNENKKLAVAAYQTKQSIELKEHLDSLEDIIKKYEKISKKIDHFYYKEN